jgi:hypothetical protein
MFSVKNYIILFVILIVLGFFHRRFEDKRLKDDDMDDYQAIQKYLLNDSTLGKTKKPILWIHVPYEYNSRNWLSFGSRSSFELNQPYLYLTTKSIIQKCDTSFHICLIDDKSFEKLIPGWNIKMKHISHPISDKIRSLALAKLIYIYGGILVPISFLCKKNLFGLYHKGSQNNKLFICENNNQNVTSTAFKHYPDINFMGAEKECPIVSDLINFMERTISSDYTSASVFLGDFDRWSEARIQSGKINLIDGIEVGTKTMDEEPIKIENLLSSNYIKLYPHAYGIWIPAKDILMRRQYEWFSRLSTKQVVESNTIIGKYMILANVPNAKEGMLVETKPKPNWVSFWKTPLGEPYWGLKPNFLGDNLLKMPYPDN